MGIVHQSKALFVPLSETELCTRLSTQTLLFEENGLILLPLETGFRIEDIPQHYKDKQIGPATAQMMFLPAEGGTTIQINSTASPYMEGFLGAAAAVTVVLIAVAAVASVRGTPIPKESINLLLIPPCITLGCANSVRVFSNRILSTLRSALALPHG